MKKITVALTAALAALAVTACGSGQSQENAKDPVQETAAGGGETSQSSGSTHMTVAWWGNQTRNERTQAALDLYEGEHEGITFDGQFNEWNDYWQKLATASAGKSLPDVIQMDYLYLDQYADNDLLVDLTPYIEAGTLHVADASEAIIDSGKVDGKVYAIPIGINAPALVYNKTVTDEAGVEIKDNMTLDEYVEVCKAIYEKTGYKSNMAYGVSQEILIAVIRGNDGHILFEDGKLGVENAQEFEAFFDIYDKGVKEGWHVSPDVFAEISAGSIEQDPLVYGSSPETMSWSAFCWSNQYVAMNNAAPEGADLQLTTWPSADPSLSNYLKPSQLFSVSRDSANPDEAAKLIDFWTNSIAANEILLGERGVPISSVVAEAIAPKLSPEEQKTIAFVNDVVTPNAAPINPPSPVGSTEVTELINQLVEQVAYGQLSSAEAAEKLYSEGNQIMADKAK